MDEKHLKTQKYLLLKEAGTKLKGKLKKQTIRLFSVGNICQARKGIARVSRYLASGPVMAPTMAVWCIGR